MSTVIAQPHDISGNGGRNLVRLDNGWLVAVAKTSDFRVRVYVSKDDGVTWNENVNASQEIGGNLINFTTIAARENKVYMITGFYNNAIHFKVFDFISNHAISQGNLNLNSAAFSRLNSGSVVINKEGTELHLTWGGRSNTLPNSDNLAYLKAIINSDGSLSWGSVELVTKINSNQDYFKNPSIALDSNGMPVILVESNNVVVATDSLKRYYGIQVFRRDRTLVYTGAFVDNKWSISNVFRTSDLINTHSNPSVVTDKDGTIHASWNGHAGNNALDIFYAKSLDGGVTWTTALNLTTSTAMNNKNGASITVDSNNDLCIVFHGYYANPNGYGMWEIKKPNNAPWGMPTLLKDFGAIGGKYTHLSTLFDQTFNGYFGETPPTVYMDTVVGAVKYIGTYTTNRVPTITTTSPSANQTFHENSTLTMAGSTTDTDIDDVVTIKFQIDSGTVRNLHSAVSDGTTPIDFSKSLTYKDGVLKDGNTVLTSILDKDTPHTISVWSEDGKGGKSNIITRTFFVVPNRAPVVTVNPIAAQSELINSNVINVSGMVTDADKNDVTVTFAINGGEEQQIYQGPPAAFTFNILLNDLKVGANTIIVKATDTYNTSGAKTLTINKTHNATPVNKAVALYKITAPTGSAKSILLWLSRTLGTLDITTEVSLTNEGEAENFVALEKTNSVVANGLRKEEFAYKGDVDKTNIVVKIMYNRTDASVIDTIKQISGVLF